MASFWDLLPASPWSPQPYAPLLDQPPLANAPTDQPPPLAPVRDLPPQFQSPLPTIASGPDTPGGFATFPAEMIGAPIQQKDLLGGILGTFFGAKPESTIPPTPQSTAPYGVIPKNLPAELRLPTPISDWQRPESDFAIDSPHNLARVERVLAAGLPTDGIVVEGPAARVRRDNARAVDHFFPGSGNFVSGDWNNITGPDAANLLLGLATTFIPGAAEARLARAGLSAARLASEAETMAAAIRAANTGLRGARLEPADQFGLLLTERGRKLLGQLDPSNAKLQGPTQGDWLSPVGQLRLVNNDIKAIREHKGLLDLEKHHETTQQFGPWFALRGINPDDYVSYMWMWDHRLKGGLHAGPNSWNRRLGDFIFGNRQASPEEAYQQLYNMLRLRADR